MNGGRSGAETGAETAGSAGAARSLTATAGVLTGASTRAAGSSEPPWKRKRADPAATVTAKTQTYENAGPPSAAPAGDSPSSAAGGTTSSRRSPQRGHRTTSRLSLVPQAGQLMLSTIYRSSRHDSRRTPICPTPLLKSSGSPKISTLAPAALDVPKNKC